MLQLKKKCLFKFFFGILSFCFFNLLVCKMVLWLSSCMPHCDEVSSLPLSSRLLLTCYCWQVHWKWSQRITRLLIQCLESTEYMEIRNALIMLTRISTVFPVTRKTGINLEKRVRDTALFFLSWITSFFPVRYVAFLHIPTFHAGS